MSDLISRQALCEYALNQKDKCVTPNDIMRFPSAQPDVTEEAVKDYCRKRCLTILTNDCFHKLSTAQPEQEIQTDITLPAVKCKDCVYLGNSVDGGIIGEFRLCAKRIVVVRESDFCIWGKEKEDGN